MQQTWAFAALSCYSWGGTSHQEVSFRKRYYGFSRLVKPCRMKWLWLDIYHFSPALVGESQPEKKLIAGPKKSSSDWSLAGDWPLCVHSQVRSLQLSSEFLSCFQRCETGMQLKYKWRIFVWALLLAMGDSMETTNLFVLSLYTMTMMGLFFLCPVRDDVSERHWCGIPVKCVMLQEAVLWPQ